MPLGALPGQAERVLEIFGAHGGAGRGPVPERGGRAAEQIAGPLQPLARHAGVMPLQREDAPGGVNPRIVGRAARRFGQHRLGLVEPAQMLQRHAEVVQQRGAGPAAVQRLPEVIRRLGPLMLARGDEPQVERGASLRRPELGHAAKLPQRFVQHVGPIEGHAEIAVLLDLGLEHPGGRRRRGSADLVGEPGGDQAVERLPGLELGEARGFDHRAEVAAAVQQGENPPLRLGELRLMSLDLSVEHRIDQVEAGDLLLDQAPLVHPPRAPSRSSDSGLIFSSVSSDSGRTPASKLKVPVFQAKRE